MYPTLFILFYKHLINNPKFMGKLFVYIHFREPFDCFIVKPKYI